MGYLCPDEYRFRHAFLVDSGSSLIVTKQTINELPIFIQSIHKSLANFYPNYPYIDNPKFGEKSKAAVYFNQNEYVYVLLKLLFYGTDDSTTRILNDLIMIRISILNHPIKCFHFKLLLLIPFTDF